MKERIERRGEERRRIEEEIFQKEKERLGASLEAPPADTQGKKRSLPVSKVQQTKNGLIRYDKLLAMNDTPPPSD